MLRVQDLRDGPVTLHVSISPLALIGIVFGSAFGLNLPPGGTYGDRAISAFGRTVFQFGFYLASNARNDIPWNTVISFSKSSHYFLGEAAPAAQFFFDADIIAKH
ncbi:hypothetical protein BS47DRAFT_782825 [Hydnum rufescens UP504]|uniref:Uncharacterized protein n=1 Tax=Hydnum rufescens UP504 TaxID=1448309 RepID=A0A9P6B0R5_9AGAM|nr:hypothetical protein BS47DRAFT_782825 [Hydnum rufescens UP504]